VVWRFTPGFDLDLYPQLLEAQPPLLREVLLHYGWIEFGAGRYNVDVAARDIGGRRGADARLRAPGGVAARSVVTHFGFACGTRKSTAPSIESSMRPGGAGKSSPGAGQMRSSRCIG
jgi:hypothetical protein